MKGSWWDLTREEVAIGLMIGGNRMIRATFRRVEAGHGFNGDPWDVDVEGACAEIAAYKSVGRYWSPSISKLKEEGGDGGPWDVRRRSEEWHDHLIRDNDPQDRPHILVIGRAPRFWVVGWLWGHEARRDEWRKSYGGREMAWFVPKGELRDMAELA
jgi:hypothetical protein